MGISSIRGGGILVYRSFALFEVSKTFNILEGKVPNFTKGDITLAVLVDGVKQDSFPDKNGHKYVGYECNNDAKLTWNNETWRALIDTDKPTICTLKFETKNNSLNGSEPVVKEGLIPVTIANDGTVTKTNTDDSNWYDYNESKWANAVILEGADTYSVGSTIPESDINAYFVWIPKYRYKLFNIEGNRVPEQEIEIEFGTTNTVDSETECIATNKSGDNGTCENGKWMTHPAFTSLDVTGIWGGKFRTSYEGTTEDYDVVASDKIQIKPNKNFWLLKTGSNIYNTAYNFNRGLDSHMMKNTEWGALVYLTNSKYGRGNSEVWINNQVDNEKTLTGCTESASASYTSNCAYPYPNENNDNRTIFQGSTTNNISGIYDNLSIYWNLVMGNYNNIQGNFGDTAISSIPSKYKDIYLGVGTDYKILGDSIGETYSWVNQDTSSFWIEQGDVFYVRGANNSLFAFYRHFAGNSWPITFHIVLSPNNR